MKLSAHTCANLLKCSIRFPIAKSRGAKGQYQPILAMMALVSEVWKKNKFFYSIIGHEEAIMIDEDVDKGCDILFAKTAYKGFSKPKCSLKPCLFGNSHFSCFDSEANEWNSFQYRDLGIELGRDEHSRRNTARMCGLTWRTSYLRGWSIFSSSPPLSTSFSPPSFVVSHPPVDRSYKRLHQELLVSENLGA